ncbi:MAG TPA: hypothetical protein PLT06_11395 [Syntrophorhabdaceae bacterium]|nr:hypothetical protein [Syntrophorhabdaceae bacterium]
MEYIPQIVEDEEAYDKWLNMRESAVKEMEALIEEAYENYKKLQDRYRVYTGKNHEWLK